MDDTTIQSLGQKLTDLELTNAERELLAALLAGGADGDADEVQGFLEIEQTATYGIARARAQLRPTVKGWSWGESQSR